MGKRGEVYIGFDGSATSGDVVVFDGQTYKFLGYTADDGTVVGEVHESFYLNAAGQRVEIPDPDSEELRRAFTGGTISFTVPLRDAETQLPALAAARPRCSKCDTVLVPCDACGAPALCGDSHCAAC